MRLSLTVFWVTLDHLIAWLEAGRSYLLHLHLLMVSLVGSDQRTVGSEGVMYPGVGHQVGLELRQVAVESPVEPKAGSDRGENLSYEPVEVCVGWSLHLQLVVTEIVNCLNSHG